MELSWLVTAECSTNWANRAVDVHRNNHLYKYQANAAIISMIYRSFTGSRGGNLSERPEWLAEMLNIVLSALFHQRNKL